MEKNAAKKTVKMKVMTIVHGQSEYRISASIRSNLRLKHEIIAKERGKKSIQVNGIMDILNDKRFRSYNDFIRTFKDVEHEKGKLINFRLFIILDVDDCTAYTKKRFINKELFARHWLYEYITPIYNDPELETTMKQAGIEVQKKKDYIVIFPTNHGDLDVSMAREFSKKLEECKSTNMNEYVEYCLSLLD